ncbi:MAG TPA: molybdopterin-dependent oxidoreductase, partial [Nitrososphaerales archaeon]|nr:molybdopterin-dependent oxidoreductase [Nitrososphaerales archaeon]
PWEERLDYRAPFFLFGSKDFTCQLSRRIAFRKTTILATKMYGKKLTPAKGGPVRLVFQGHKCYESIKSVDRIVLLGKRTKTTARSIATARIRNK